MSEHILETAAQRNADTASTDEASYDPGSEESYRTVIDDLRTARVAETDVDDPSD